MYIFSIKYLVLTVYFLGMLFAKVNYSQQNDLLDFKTVDAEFILLSSDVFMNNPSHITTNKYTINTLYNKIKTLESISDNFRSIQIIRSNLNLIKENIDHNSLFYIVEVLLSNNELLTALDILKYASKHGDKSLISNIKFIFAKYYFNRSQYLKSQFFLKGISADLSIDNGHYSHILNGVIQQKLKKHRQSLTYYEAVPATSKYYHYAQLNKAIVYIRQGWWSDAHIIIKKLLKNNRHPSGRKDDIINRLYLVTGYSFLQQEYFRESRESFRNINKQSNYANSALLGIALSAANQGDNIGALNILNILQKKNTSTLAVEETYLLLPYIYEKIGQHKTAAASYSIALNHYKKRIYKLKSLLSNITHNPDPKISENAFLTKTNITSTSDIKTKQLIKNLKTLKLFKIKNKSAPLASKIETLISSHNKLLTTIVSNKINNRINFLESYQNQSQFGLARLYDNSQNNN